MACSLPPSLRGPWQQPWYVVCLRYHMFSAGCKATNVIPPFVVTCRVQSCGPTQTAVQLAYLGGVVGNSTYANDFLRFTPCVR